MAHTRRHRQQHGRFLADREEKMNSLRSFTRPRPGPPARDLAGVGVDFGSEVECRGSNERAGDVSSTPFSRPATYTGRPAALNCVSKSNPNSAG